MSVKKTMPELERISSNHYAEKHSEGLVIVIDNLRSAHNVGSIFRTSDAFGIAKIYLCGITCQTDNRELQKTALGAEIAIPSEYKFTTVEIIQELKSNHYQILSLEQTKNSQLLSANLFDKSKKYALVIGNEVEGVSDEVLALTDSVIEIPQIGSKHSLNASNAASIVIWEYFQQMQ